MTLLIALIANSIHLKLVGEQYVYSGTIVFIWILHLLCKGSRGE